MLAKNRSKIAKKLLTIMMFSMSMLVSYAGFSLPITVLGHTPAFPISVNTGQSTTVTYTIQNNLPAEFTLAPSLDTNTRFTYVSSGSLARTGGTCASGVSGGDTCTIILTYTAPTTVPATNPVSTTIQFQADNGEREGEIPAESGSFTVSSEGGVKCWGLNNYGQLGNGTTTNSNTPVDVTGLSSGITTVATTEASVCSVSTNGSVKCWGLNNYGELGDGTTTNSSTPVDVTGLSSGVSAVTGGEDHICALLTSGGVKCWGYNGHGQLGDSSTITRYTPVDVTGLSSGVSAITGGGYHTCALLTNGGVKCWGLNSDGQLGNGTTTSSSTPVDVTGLSSGVSAITGGGYHTCALLTSGGVKCWGYNGHGQLGDGTTTSSSTPVDVTGLSSGVSAIVGGWISSCALLTDGGVKCWGNNTYGQFGNGTTTSSSTPVDVSGLSQVTAIMNHQESGWHYCAILNTGALKCWGFNGYGQLGDGTTTTPRKTPVDVTGLSSGTLVVTAGDSSTCAIVSP